MTVPGVAAGSPDDVFVQQLEPSSSTSSHSSPTVSTSVSTRKGKGKAQASLNKPRKKDPTLDSTSSSPSKRTRSPPTHATASSSTPTLWRRKMFYVPTALAALIPAYLFSAHIRPALFATRAWSDSDAPQYAQVVHPINFAVLDTVLPPMQFNLSNIFVPPGSTLESLMAKPFHIYDDSFYDIIGSNPTLTLIADGGEDPLFHEAVTWNPPTDEMFFVQNAGATAAGTGLNKSAIIQKISLSQAATAAAAGMRNASGQVDVQTVDTKVQVVNPNGGTNFMGKILWMGEGMGDDVTSAVYEMDPVTYETKVILNNYFGRQFNSLNDVAVNPMNKLIYFTDVTYGFLQNFRPTPGLPNQVYMFDYVTGLVSVVADGFNKPNGITFSPDGSVAYICDTGAQNSFLGLNQSFPATIYHMPVNSDGTFGPSQVFAFVSPGVPDGIHCDSNGNVYAGCGDGVQVFNPSGKLIGKIFLGTTSANFQFAGQGRMVICAETLLYYATLAATGAPITDYDYSGVV